MSSIPTRNYYADIDAKNRENINFVLSTMEGEVFPYPNVVKVEKKLRRAGDEAREKVHPLKYMKYVMSDERLRGYFQNIHGGLWKMMKSGFINSFRAAVDNENLDDKMVQDFCKASPVKYSKVTRLFKERDWSAFLSYMHHA